MSHVPPSPSVTKVPPTPAVILVALAGVAIVTALAIGAMASGKMTVALLLAAAPIVGYALLTNPNMSTCLALFLVYTNAPVILKNFHGVPHIVAISMPALLLVPIAYHVLFRREPILLPRVLAWAGLFVVVQALGVFTAKEPELAFDGLYISLTEGVALFLLIVNAVRTPQALRGAVWSLVAAAAFLGAASLHQNATGSYHKTYGGFAQVPGNSFGVDGHRGQTRQYRAGGPLAVENRFAQIMLMVVPLALCCFWGEQRPQMKLVALLALGVIGGGWALAFSRGSAVALVLTMMVMTAMGYLRVKQTAVVGVLGLVLLLLVPQYRARLLSLVDITNFLSERASAAGRVDGAITGRLTEMIAAGRVFADHPLIGVGPTMFKYHSRDYSKEGGYKRLKGNRQAHSLYLSIAAEHGLFGSLFFFAAIGVTLRNLSRARQRCLEVDPRTAYLLLALTLAITVYLTTGLFAHFSFIRYFWTILGLATAAVYVGSNVCASDGHKAEASASKEHSAE